MEGRKGGSRFWSGGRCSISFLLFLFLTFALLLSVSRCKYPYTSQYNSTTAPDGARRRPLVASACGCKIQLGLLSHFPLTDMYTQSPLPLPSSLETADQTADIPFQLFNLCRKYFFVKVCTPYLRHNGLQQQDRRMPSHSTYAHTRRWRVETAMRSCLLWHSKRVGGEHHPFGSAVPVFKVKRGLFWMVLFSDLMFHIFVCWFCSVLLFCYYYHFGLFGSFLSEFYQTGQLSFMTQADSF